MTTNEQRQITNNRLRRTKFDLNSCLIIPPSSLFLWVLLGAALGSGACANFQAAGTNQAAPSMALDHASTASGGDARERQLRFLEERVHHDPDDFSANNKLAGLYLQNLRETGNVAYLDLAFRAARASLDSVPEVRNTGGLAALAQAEFASHDFINARDHAQRLIVLDPRKIYPYTLLGDSLLELGDYAEAVKVFERMGKINDSPNIESSIRRARLAQLRGDKSGALKSYSAALTLALNFSEPPRETVAWLHWQLGETAFASGDYEKAEQHYRDSLSIFPNYYRADASLGRVLAARQDLTGAIMQYEKVIRILPDPTYVAALGDVEQLAGRADDSRRQYELVEQIGHLSALNGALYNRQLALFYADHDLKADEAYRLALREYETRQDIYGADAVAWTALKAGKISEAQTAIKEALRLGTEDAKMFYHAGMIAAASGDKTAAHDFLQRALTLNPEFDPLQSKISKNAFKS